MNKNTLKIFGNTIRFYRNKLGITQEKLAEECGFHRTYIGQIERGERNPSLRNIEIISKSFNISLSELFKTFENIKSTFVSK